MSGLISGAVARFVARLAKAGGAGGVGFSHSQAYEPGTIGAKARKRVNVSDAPFNAKGDGTANDTAAFHAARDLAGAGERVEFGAGVYRLAAAFNNSVELVGTKATILKAANGATHVLSLGRHMPSSDWNYHKVEAIEFDGNGKASYGIDFNDSNPVYPEFGGRWVLDRCTFANASVGVYAKTGNIGNTYNQCHFRNNDYGVRLTTEGSAGKMHAGCSIFNGGEFSANAKAAIYINDLMDGLGQYDFNNVIVEGNPGFGVFMNLNNLAPFAGITFRNFWEEGNATAAQVEIDGVNYAPRAIYIKNARPVVFENSFLKDVQLVNSTVMARGCRIDAATAEGLHLDVDATSMLIVDDLYTNGPHSGVPFVRSIASVAGVNATSNYSVRGPLKTWRTAPTGGITLAKETYDGAGPWLFNGTVGAEAVGANDGVISTRCAELIIPAGHTLVRPGMFKPTVGKWVVWGIHFKLQAGQKLAVAAFSYDSVLGDIYQRGVGEWVATFGIQKVGEAFGNVTTYFQNSSNAQTVIRLADFFVVEFDSMEAAYAFVNSGAAVR